MYTVGVQPLIGSRVVLILLIYVPPYKCVTLQNVVVLTCQILVYVMSST